MTALRAASLVFSLLLVATVGSPTAPFASSAVAAPKKPVPAPAALTFNMMARIGYSLPGEPAGPEQLLNAKVWLRGDRARIESSAGGEPSVVIFAPPYLYRLLPRAKAGVRWTTSTNKPSTVTAFSPQELLRNPASIRRALTEGGARRTGATTLNGTACDLYVAQNFRGKGTTARAWLRRSDALPVRLEVKGPQFNVAASWRDYKRPQSLPSALFTPPKNYKIREAQGAPPFSGL